MSFDETIHAVEGAGSTTEEFRAAPWTSRNARRLFLIEKRFHKSGLTQAEEAELATLQQEAEARMDQAMPPPKMMLEEWERIVARAEAGARIPPRR